MPVNAWKARLLPGSFRGIPFFIDTHQLQGGRHAIPHEPPDRPKNFTEDVGRKSKTFNVEAHILGDNYFFIRDGLIAALEKRGKGILVHPYLGFKEVVTDGYTVAEDTLVGRFCRISMTFVEAGEPSAPFSTIDKITSYFTAAAVVVAQVKNAYQTVFSLANLPAFATAGFVLQIQDAVDMFKVSKSKVRSVSEVSAQLSARLGIIENNKETLAQNPATNAEETDTVLQLFGGLVPDAPSDETIDTTGGRDDKLAVFNDMLVHGDENEDLPETTPTRRQEKKNALAYSDMIQQLAIVRLADQVIRKQFTTNDEATEARKVVSENIDKQLKKERTDDEVFQALENLNARLVAAVPDTTSELANEQSVTLLEFIPSIVLAYDLYESADNERDIIKRNGVRNPGFVEGNLTVLSK